MPRALPALAGTPCDAAVVMRTRSARLLCSDDARQLRCGGSALDIFRSCACRLCACRSKTGRQPEGPIALARRMHALQLPPAPARGPGRPPAARAGGRPQGAAGRARRRPTPSCSGTCSTWPARARWRASARASSWPRRPCCRAACRASCSRPGARPARPPTLWCPACPCSRAVAAGQPVARAGCGLMCVPLPCPHPRCPA